MKNQTNDLDKIISSPDFQEDWEYDANEPPNEGFSGAQLTLCPRCESYVEEQTHSCSDIDCEYFDPRSE